VPSPELGDHEVEPDVAVPSSLPGAQIVDTIHLAVQAEEGVFLSVVDRYVIYDQSLSFTASESMVLSSWGMVSMEDVDAGSFIEEVVEGEEGYEDASSMPEDSSLPRLAMNHRDTEPSGLGTTLTVWRGEHLVTHTPRPRPALVRASPISALGGMEPCASGPPILPRHVLELCGHGRICCAQQSRAGLHGGG
jgi:hypothetical protein